MEAGGRGGRRGRRRGGGGGRRRVVVLAIHTHSSFVLFHDGFFSRRCRHCRQASGVLLFEERDDKRGGI